MTDPKRCLQAETLATDLRVQSDALPAGDPNKALLAARADIVEQRECAGGVASITSNNPTLKPEVSRGASLGLVFEPTKDFHVAMDGGNREEPGQHSACTGSFARIEGAQ